MATRRFQLHLVSVIVLTVTAGILLGVNVRPQRLFPIEGYQDWSVWQRGWPLTFEIYSDSEDLNSEFNVNELTEELSQVRHYRASRITTDIACALLIVLGATAITEWLERRRDDKREAARR